MVALLHAVDRAHKTVPHQGMSDRDVKKRAKEVAEGQWAAKAVKDAVAAAMAATTAAMVAATAVVTTGDLTAGREPCGPPAMRRASALSDARAGSRPRGW